MLAGEGGAERVLADDGEDAAQFVGNHRAAVADAVDKDAAVTFALGHRQGCRIDEVRQIAGLFVVRAEILDFMAFALKIRLDLCLLYTSRCV